MSKALDGVRILDFTHVQSGPTCTQLLAWFGADVIKVERAGEGDATRGQLRDIPGVDSLYFTMLNHNKRSITLDTKNPKGKQVLDTLIKECDVLVENFAPGALDRMGITWDHIQKLNPRMIVASVKGFGPGPYEDCKVYENVAQCAGGSASTTGFDDGPPMVTGAQIGDSGTGLHLALGIVAALYQRNSTAAGPAAAGTNPHHARVPAVPGRQVWRCCATGRECLRWRTARLHPQMQRLGDRPQRLHLLHYSGRCMACGV
jgi:formyl-CoA transferase